MDYAFYVPQTINPGSNPSASLGFKNNLHNYLESKMEVDGNTYKATYHLQYDNEYSHGLVKCSSSPKTGVSGFNFAGWYLGSASNGTISISRRTTSSVLSFDDRMVALYWTDNNANPVVYKSLMPVYYLKSNGITISFDKQNGSGGSDSITTTYTYTMPSISVPSRSGYTFEGYYTEANGGGTKYYNSDGSPAITTCDLVGSTTLYANWISNTYFFDINTNLDGTHWTVEQDYCSYDVYIDGSRAAYQVSDYNAKLKVGQKYEIRNIKTSTDKIYDGVLRGSLSGTISGFTEVILKLRTATWEDYAASSYASGNGTEADPYIIKTPRQLGKLAKDSRSSNLSGKYYKLGANIDLSAHIWQGIGTGDYRFGGDFNGDMYTISNIKTQIDYFINDFAGLFNRADATIRNVIVKDSNMEARDKVGAILAHGRSQISNCIAQNVNVITSDGSAGGIVGGPWSSATASMLIESCTFKGGRIEGKVAGGIGGACTNSNVTIKDCNVLNATIKGSSVSNVLCGNISGGKILSSYGYGTVNATAIKQMYGDSSAWGNWSYSPSLNGGYPVQKTLFAIGGLTGSQNVYNYLKNTLGFTVI